jgi:hypothetical protein
MIEALDLLRGVMRDRITHRANLVEEYGESSTTSSEIGGKKTEK